MQLAEPGSIEAELVAKLNLGKNVLVALPFGLPIGSWKLVKNPKRI
jgi:hypothetical protein